MNRDEIFRKAIALLKDAKDTTDEHHRACNVRAVRAMIHHWEHSCENQCHEECEVGECVCDNS